MKRLISAHFGLMAALMLVMTPVQGFAAKEESSTATEKADNTEKKTEKADKTTKKDKKKDTDAIGDRDVSKGVNFYSIEKEIALGKQVAQEIERQAKIIDDPVIAEYVNRVGQNLVRNSDVKVPVTIKVLDAEEVNAMALPGGFFFVNSGLHPEGGQRIGVGWRDGARDRAYCCASRHAPGDPRSSDQPRVRSR